MPLLHAVSREALRRSLAGSMALPAAQRTLAAAVKGASAMRPRLGQEVEEATCQWMHDAASEAGGVPPAPPPPPADCSNNIVQVFAQPLWLGTVALP